VTVYRVGFAGTARPGRVTRAQIQELHRFMLQLKIDPAQPFQVEWHHGGAPEADRISHFLALALGFRIVVHPGPKSDPRDFPMADAVYGPAYDNLQRDDDIARVTSELVAVPRTNREFRRSGTWTTVRRARRYGRPITLILPDGTVTGDTTDHLAEAT
jgi:hypothetical protein